MTTGIMTFDEYCQKSGIVNGPHYEPFKRFCIIDGSIDKQFNEIGWLWLLHDYFRQLKDIKDNEGT